MNIGIFDSGHGGELVADKLKSLLPEHNYIVINDLAHAPYGERSYEDIRQLTDRAIQTLLGQCPLIVLACNTASVAAIAHLRQSYPKTLFVGFEPMIKPAAALTKTKHITLLATHATQHSLNTKKLAQAYASDTTIDMVATFGWATHVDNNTQDRISLDDVAASVAAGSDTIIIGCTHYIALIPRLEQLFPTVTILEPTEAVSRQITRQLQLLPQ